MSAPTVLLDACTLVPIRLTSCLLSLAEAGLFVPLWSEEILEEVERNLPRLKGMDSASIRRRSFVGDRFRISMMGRSAIPRVGVG